MSLFVALDHEGLAVLSSPYPGSHVASALGVRQALCWVWVAFENLHFGMLLVQLSLRLQSGCTTSFPVPAVKSLVLNWSTSSLLLGASLG